jgi:2,3-bisphosphoglycerate-dependent phosphoglycerate mutase
MRKIVLLRHGQSVWNQERRFTGWTDVDLSVQGRADAEHAGQLLKAGGFTFDLCFTSYLKRAITTLWTVLETMDLMWVPVQKSWRLNERHYGALEGLSREETARRYGAEQVRIWQQHFEVRPPALDASDARFPGHDPRYAGLPRTELPYTESIKDVRARVLPYWHQIIVPQIREGKSILIVAHGNSLRGLVTYLDDVAEADIPMVERPLTGEPFVYKLDDTGKPVRRYYLRRRTQLKTLAKEIFRSRTLTAGIKQIVPPEALSEDTPPLERAAPCLDDKRCPPLGGGPVGEK